MDHIYKYHQYLSYGFITPSFILPYSIFFHVDIQCALHFPFLYGHQLIWHYNLTCIFVLPFWLLIFPMKWWKIHPKNCSHLYQMIASNWETLPKKHTIKAQALNFWRFSEMVLDLLHLHQHNCVKLGSYTCRKICSNIVCINFKHSNNPIWWNHINPSPFSPINKSWPPFFLQWFPFRNKG
jgi:hypothetical protein